MNSKGTDVTDQTFGKTWNLYRVGAYTLAGGGVSELAGQGFEKGALFAGAIAFARFAYNEWVGYDVTWKPGDGVEGKRRFTMSHEGKSNVGEQATACGNNPDCWLNEGGRILRFANQIPGVNATAGLHDVMQIKLDQFFGGGASGAFMRSALCVPQMIPAAIFATGALLADPFAIILYSTDRR